MADNTNPVVLIKHKTGDWVRVYFMYYYMCDSGTFSHCLVPFNNLTIDFHSNFGYWITDKYGFWFPEINHPNERKILQSNKFILGDNIWAEDVEDIMFLYEDDLLYLGWKIEELYKCIEGKRK